MTSSTQTPDFTAIKGRQRQTWASGDYHMIASIIMPVAERLCDAVDLRANQRVLDVATGSANAAIAAARRLCTVTGVDYVPALLDRGRARAEAEGLPVTFEEGDAEALSAEDGSFDAVTISFGLRNVADVDQALREMRRVTRPGGRILVCEFSTPPNPVVRFGYRQHLTHGLPLIAKVSSNPESYSYLGESILAWPDQPALAAMLREAGRTSAKWRNLSFGVAAMHKAVNP